MCPGVLPDAEVWELRALSKVLQKTSHLYCSDRGQPSLWVGLSQASSPPRAMMGRGPEDRCLHSRASKWGRDAGWLGSSSASWIPAGMISSILIQVEERRGKTVE